MYEDILLGFEFEVETNDESQIYSFIDEVSFITGYTEHCVHEYHATDFKTAEGEWRVERDSSILGAEFISPPMPYIEAKEMVKNFFKIIHSSANVMITDNCGLHVGMSINGTVDNLDLSNFLVSLNQSFIASLWPKRIKSMYVKNIGKQIDNLKNINDINIENFATHLFSLGHTFISLKNFNYKRYLELRVPGGKDYNYKFKELFALIDYVANRMLLNNKPLLNSSDSSKTTNKKCNKKIISYINRMQKRSQRSDSWGYETITNKLNSEKLLTSNIFSGILNSIITIIEYSNYNRETLCKNLNTKNCLYTLIKYTILHKKMYPNVSYYVSRFLEKVKKLELYVDIPKKESTSDKVKIFKQWRCLPTPLLVDLLSSIDSKHACKYLTKHTPGGVLLALTSDPRGVLEKHAIAHAFKYNKVK